MLWATLLLACRGVWAPADPTLPAETGQGATAVVELGTPPRNLIVISMDTTRKDHVDRYATDGVERMPFLSSLLDESVVLDDHVQCANWTYPSMNCTFTGVYLEDDTFFPRYGEVGKPVPEGQRTLAGLLGEQGFTSLLITSNYYFSGLIGSAQGYDVDELLSHVDTATIGSAGVSGLAAIQAAGDTSPFFLHLHLFEPHDPYLPPPEYLGDLSGAPEAPWDLSTELGQALAVQGYYGQPPEAQEAIRYWFERGYSGELRWMDHQLEGVWADLDAHGWLDDTLVVFLTDHGEAFWEHGLTGHGLFLAGEENDAILGFWARGLAPRAWDGPTHAVDLVPTVLHALGVPVPADLSGVPVGLAAPDRYRFTATAGIQGPFQAVIAGDWRLMYGWSGILRLWNFVEDPQEVDDRSADEPERVEELWRQLEPRTARMQALIPEETAVLPP